MAANLNPTIRGDLIVGNAVQPNNAGLILFTGGIWNKILDNPNSRFENLVTDRKSVV